MERRNRWLVLVGIILFASLTASCDSGVGEPAADFSLELHGGDTFVLSEQATPVLMFFWAEW